MITKTVCFILILFLTLGSKIRLNNPQIAKRKNCYHSLNPKTDSPEIFKVSRDTIQENIEGKLSKALLIHDKYYAFYEVRDPMSTQAIKKFYIIEKSGKNKKEIKVPQGILEDTYPKLNYWHGRIIVNTEFHKCTYYLDEDKGEFVKNPEIIKVPLFEDETCAVTSDCHGEFGSTIYFKNKSTGTTDSAFSGCPFVVNKLGDKYFVNTDGMPDGDIIEIHDPIKVEATTKNIPLNMASRLTTRTVFTNDNFNSHFYIPTSFVTKGILYHIYNFRHIEFRLDEKKERVIITKDSVKIGIINNGVFKPVYTFKDKFDIELQQHLSSDYQICTFHTENRIQIGFKKDIPPYREAKYGFIEIKGNEIKIHYFISKKAG
jgi:hypothetical protein